MSSFLNSKKRRSRKLVLFMLGVSMAFKLDCNATFDTSKRHIVNRDAIVGYTTKTEELHDLELSYISNIENGISDFEIDEENGKKLLTHICHLYADVEGTKYSYIDGVISISEDSFLALKDNTVNATSRFEEYKNWIVDTVNSNIKLNDSDRGIVNQINNYIKDNFTYEVTNNPLYTFTETGKGQCFHYGQLFRDMCLAVGIGAEYVEGDDHAWNYVTIGDIRYKFDVTLNDSYNTDEYSWVEE